MIIINKENNINDEVKNNIAFSHTDKILYNNKDLTKHR